MNIRTLGYPFIRTDSGLFNPIDSYQQNARNKVLNLLSTNKGQRVISQNCEFGVDIHKLLFQNIHYPNFQQTFGKQIEKAIKMWIKQIEKVKVKVQTLQQTIVIAINYIIGEFDDIITLEFDITNE